MNTENICEIDESGGKGKRIKICQYCGAYFSEIEFPQTFERMITCGSIECMGKRRIEMWKLRNKREEVST